MSTNTLTASLRRQWVRLAVVAVIALVVGFALRGGGGPRPDAPVHDHTGEQQAAEVWTCSMHPQIRQPGPGQCPICGMDLIPVESGGAGQEGGERELTLSPLARKLAGIEVAPVERKFVTAEIRMVGKVEYDESRVRHIAAWVSGRLDRLYIDYTGIEVREGDQMASLYSPELFATQEELIQARKAAADLEKSDLASMRETARETIKAVQEKLRLWGLTEEQITEIEARGAPSDHVTINAPMSGTIIEKHAAEGMYVKTGERIYTIADLSEVWVKLDAYESDLPWIRPGQKVEFHAEAYPGQIFKGKIAFIDPVLDAKTRTVKVRVNVKNSDGKLKPEMFVHAVVQAGVAMDEAPLVIPASGPLLTGKRAVVYVAVPGKDGTYEGREVTLGPRAGDHYVVESGLSEGESVVVSGNFKIDSASQIRAMPSMMSPEGGAPPPGHQHGVPAGGHEEHAQASVMQRFEAPGAFRTQVDVVLYDYFAIHESLSRDDIDGARKHAKVFVDAVNAVDMALLDGSAHAAWMSELTNIKANAEAIATADAIEPARAAFSPLSEALTRVVRQFGTAGKQPVLRFHCPMAFGGKGADWLQNRQGTENPYYGSMMFTCGTEEETLVAGAASSGAGATDE